MVVTVTNGGYIKRVPLSTYRAQRRGGKGRAGMATRDEDFVSRVRRQHPHADAVLLEPRHGLQAQGLPLPLGTPQARGKAMVNLLPLADGETITTVMPLPEDETPGAICSSCSPRPAATCAATACRISPTSWPTARSP
jgi:DNA gyrase subunit A